MPTYFLDSSALVKRYRKETGTARVLELRQSSAKMVIAALSCVETTSAIVRRGRVSGIAAELLDTALEALARDVRELFEVIDLSPSVLAKAADIARTHALRAADSIQLACAILARPEGGSAAEFLFVSTDRELNAAAAAEGFVIFDPSLGG
jgi:predicted nucleic acid-binding protein